MCLQYSRFSFIIPHDVYWMTHLTGKGIQERRLYFVSSFLLAPKYMWLFLWKLLAWTGCCLGVHCSAFALLNICFCSKVPNLLGNPWSNIFWLWKFQNLLNLLCGLQFMTDWKHCCFMADVGPTVLEMHNGNQMYSATHSILSLHY